MMSEALRKAREYEAGAQVPESERPAFHLTARIGWMNDPNGFSVYRGEYHLFYQYYPYGAVWGPMHWGHAKTKDFLSWEYLPAALAPDQDYDQDGCWSGGAAELPDGRQLLIYTGRKGEDSKTAYQTQCLAVGDGLDYEKYGKNPVLTAAALPAGGSPHDFRDPKVWRERDGMFYAVTVTRTEDGSGAALLYQSADGFGWRFAGVLERCRNEYGNMWECPDFFPLDGKQVLLASPIGMAEKGLEFHAGYGTIALIGRYHRENAVFARESVRTLDHGLDFYAAQTLETPDGRRVMIAWMQNWDSVKIQPREPYLCGAMTVPRELSIREGRLIQNPVRELERWRVNPVVYRNVRVSREAALDGIRGRVLDLALAVRPAPEGGFARFYIHLAADAERRITIAYEPERGVIRVDRSLCGISGGIRHTREFPVQTRRGALRLRLVMDRRSVELFANGGEQAATFLLYTPESADGIRFAAEGGAALLDVEKYDLKRPAP